MFIKVILMLSKADPLVIPTWERENNYLWRHRIMKRTGFGIDRFTLDSWLATYYSLYNLVCISQVPKGKYGRIFFMQCYNGPKILT